MRSLLWALVALPLLALANCKPAVADAAPLASKGLAAGVIASSVDSLSVRVSWTAYTDGAGAADSYLDSVFVASALVHSESTSALADTLVIKRPAAGASVTLTFHVRAVRRGKVGAAGTLTWTYTQSDVAPGAPGGLKVDTLAFVLPASRIVAVVPSGFSCLPGDSAKLRAVAIVSTSDTSSIRVLTASDTVTPTGPIRWAVADTCRQAVHPIAGTAQAWGICKVRPEPSGTQPIAAESCT